MSLVLAELPCEYSDLTYAKEVHGSDLTRL